MTTQLTPIDSAQHGFHVAGVSLNEACGALVAAIDSHEAGIVAAGCAAQLIDVGKETARRVKERRIELIEERGAFNFNNERTYVGVEKEKEIEDTEAAMTLALDLTGGDVGELLKLLTSKPFKHGALTALAESMGRGDEARALVKVKEKKDLKTGVAKVGLHTVPLAMLEGR